MIFTRFYAFLAIFTRFFAMHKSSAAGLKLFCTPDHNPKSPGIHGVSKNTHTIAGWQSCAMEITQYLIFEDRERIDIAEWISGTTDTKSWYLNFLQGCLVVEIMVIHVKFIICVVTGQCNAISTCSPECLCIYTGLHVLIVLHWPCVCNVYWVYINCIIPVSVSISVCRPVCLCICVYNVYNVYHI